MWYEFPQAVLIRQAAALHQMVESGRADVVGFLLEAGVAPNVTLSVCFSAYVLVVSLRAIFCSSLVH